MKNIRRDCYIKFMAEMRGGLSVMQEFGKEIDALSQKIDSGKYSPEHILKLKAQVVDLEKKIEAERQQRNRNIAALISQTQEALEREVEPRGEDITADSKLLQFNPTEKELVSLLYRHEANPTMLRIISTHARERGINLPVVFHWNEEEKAILGGLASAADTCLKWYRNPATVFERVFSPSCQFERVFNVEDDKFQRPFPSVSYSDERVANAIRLLNDNKGMSEQTQQEIIEEFRGHTGVLTILLNTANKAGQSAAELRAAELLVKAEKAED